MKSNGKNLYLFVLKISGSNQALSLTKKSNSCKRKYVLSEQLSRNLIQPSNVINIGSISKKNAYLSDIVYGDFELLKNDYAFLQQRNEQLTVENQSLTDSNDKLKAQMNRNHENSSIPSSKENFPKKIKNS